MKLLISFAIATICSSSAFAEAKTLSLPLTRTVNEGTYLHCEYMTDVDLGGATAAKPFNVFIRYDQYPGGYFSTPNQSQQSVKLHNGRIILNISGVKYAHGGKNCPATYEVLLIN